MEAKLIVLDGKQGGNEIPLPETVFVIGRDARCHLRPHCPSVSKLHCAIASWAGLVRVQDLKSRNGTLVNGQRIAKETTVRNGDTLQIGTLRFEFRITSVCGLPTNAPIAREEVDWLLDSAPDTEVLSHGLQTQSMPIVTDDDLVRVPPAKRPSKVVSAGKNLHDYFAQRRGE